MLDLECEKERERMGKKESSNVRRTSGGEEEGRYTGGDMRGRQEFKKKGLWRRVKLCRRVSCRKNRRVGKELGWISAGPLEYLEPKKNGHTVHLERRFLDRRDNLLKSSQSDGRISAEHKTTLM